MLSRNCAVLLTECGEDEPPVLTGDRCCRFTTLNSENHLRAGNGQAGVEGGRSVLEGDRYCLAGAVLYVWAADLLDTPRRASSRARLLVVTAFGL